MRGSESALIFCEALAWSRWRSGSTSGSRAAVRARAERWKLLVEAFLALGVVFVTLAIPLALDARWTSAAWALEGAAIFWFGIRQQRRLARAFGMLLHWALAVSYGTAYSISRRWVRSWRRSFIGGVLLAFAGLWTALLIRRAGARVTAFERGLEAFAFVWGTLWWLFAAWHGDRFALASE